jgi:hypothetical protein
MKTVGILNALVGSESPSIEFGRKQDSSSPTIQKVTVKLFLDVDGVINHYPRSAKTEFNLKSDDAMGYEIQYHREIFEKLAALPVEIHWLTTWRDDANKWIAPMLGWSDLPVVGREEYDSQIAWSNKPSYWWKYITLQNLNLQEPFIWVDDEIWGYGIEEIWEDVFDPHLFITPKGSLSYSDLDEVERFANGIFRR